MDRKVVVTGMGAITPLGNDVNTLWENLIAGKLGIGPITRFDTTDSSSSFFEASIPALIKAT